MNGAKGYARRGGVLVGGLVGGVVGDFFAMVFLIPFALLFAPLHVPFRPILGGVAAALIAFWVGERFAPGGRGGRLWPIVWVTVAAAVLFEVVLVAAGPRVGGMVSRPMQALLVGAVAGVAALALRGPRDGRSRSIED